MTDAVLNQPDRQEALSRAYVQAMAAGAGYSTSRPNLDRDSVDITIEARGNMRPRLDVQLKATINLTQKGDGVSFALPIKNYNDLRLTTQVPRILVILEMPKQSNDWITVTTEELILRRAAYWVSLHGWPDKENTSNVTVTLPATNRFDIESLRSLMDQSRHGKVG